VTRTETERCRQIARSIGRGDYRCLNGDGERLVRLRATELGTTSVQLMHQWASDHRIPGTPGPADRDHTIPPGRVKDPPDADDVDDDDDDEPEHKRPDDDDDDEPDDSQTNSNGCACQCGPCRADDCERCSNPDCDDENCVHADESEDGETEARIVWKDGFPQMIRD
jgi:hypothetical protein